MTISHAGKEIPLGAHALLLPKALLLLFVVASAAPVVLATPIVPKFSIDPASPSIGGTLTPDDILRAGPSVFKEGSSLNLADQVQMGIFDNLEALSFGKDPIRNPLFFSVDRVAVGLLGTAVNDQARPGSEEASGDVFTALPPSGTNQLFLDEQALGLIPGFFGDDLEGLELDTLPPHIYFSIDLFSVKNAFFGGSLSNDIFIDAFPLLYASGETHIGLLPLDDLDALVLDDTFQPGVLNRGIDKALFSLSTSSPSTFTSTGGVYIPCTRFGVSPADVCFTDFTGSYSPWATAPSIGLRPDDNLDALDTLDTTIIPEPATGCLVAITLVVLARRGRRRSIALEG